MAEHSSTAPLRRPGLAGVYGFRLLYQPRSRGRILGATAVIAVLAYAYSSIVQLVTLRDMDLRFDFQQFYDAGAALGRGADPYQAFLDSCPGYHWCLGGYIYPPLLAELVRPLTVLPLSAAVRVWLGLSQLCLVLAVVLIGRTLRGHVSTTALSLLLVATVAFRPLLYTLFFAQVGLLLTALMAATVASYMRGGRAQGAGVATGISAVLRVSPLVLLPVFLRRPRALVAAGGSAALLLLGLWLLTPFTAEYFTSVLPRIGASTGILDNQAPQGVLLRAAFLWHLSAPSGPLVSGLLALLVLAPTGWLALRHDGDLAWRGAVIAAFIAAMPLVSSLTWQHHLVTELLVYAALAPALSARGMGVARGLALASYPLMWLDRHYTDAAVGALGLAGPSGWRVAPFLLVTGLNLLGMISLWGATMVALRRLAKPPSTT